MEYDVKGSKLSGYYVGSFIIKKNAFLPHGYGKLFSHQDKINILYNGYWKNGMFDGIGYRCSVDKMNQYIGSFRQNFRHGFGKFCGNAQCLSKSNDDFFIVYEGLWSEHKMHGTGQLCKSNGEIYDGIFDKGNSISKVFIRKEVMPFKPVMKKEKSIEKKLSDNKLSKKYD